MQVEAHNCQIGCHTEPHNKKVQLSNTNYNNSILLEVAISGN